MLGSIFVGTAHKSLTSYAKAYSAADFLTASDRIREVPLTPDGVEDIIGAIVHPLKEQELWKRFVSQDGVFNSFGIECARLKLFDWLSAPQIRNRIIEDLYPMHPMATYILLPVSS